MTEETYSMVRNSAFNLANLMIHNYHDAEDIAQIVSLKFLLNQEEINNPIAWSNKVTKNEVYTRFKKGKKSELLLQKQVIENYEDKLVDIMNEIQYSDKMISSKEAKQLLSTEDYRIFNLWLKSNFKVTKIAKSLNLSYYSAHTRVYKMKRNLRSQKLKKEGYTTSKEIINYNTNKNIVKFIKMFVNKMKSNNMESLHSYLEYIPKEKIQSLDITKILDYEVRLKENMIHEILLPYINSQAQVQFCGIRFKIDKRNRIKVIEFISKPQSVLTIHQPKEQILNKLPKTEKGIIQIDFNDAKKILEEDPL